MKQKYKILFIGTLTLLSVSFAASLLYIKSIENEVYKSFKEKLNQINDQKKQLTFKSQSILEKDSLVNLNYLKEYILLSDLSSLEQQTIISFYEDYLNKINLKNEEIKLPNIIENHCSDFNCMQSNIAFSKIPPALWQGLIAIEDIRFLDHQGVDLISILRALIADIKAMKIVQGGSTLTQQIIKNLFLSNEKSFLRKIKEALYALYIEGYFTKDEIISVYLNESFWGTFQGINLKGVYIASLSLFEKLPLNLGPFEVALLVSMLKGPNIYHPLKNNQKLFQRAKFVCEKTCIDKTKDIWPEKKYEEWIKKVKDKNSNNYLRIIFQLNAKLKNFDLSDYEKFIFLKSYFSFVKENKNKLQNFDFAFKSIIYDFRSEKTLFTYYSKIEREEDKALKNEFHQVGSILKPIIYQIILEQTKIDIEDLVSTEKLNIKTKSGTWSPKDHAKLEEETIRESLQLSHNRPLLRLVEQMGYSNLEAILKLKIPKLLTPLSEYPAQLLGSVELSMEEVLNIYKELFTNFCFNQSKKSIVMALSLPTETTIRHYIRSNFKYTNMFGKTGTTNLGRDSWFISFDGDRIYLSWFGLESNKDNKKFPFSGASSSFLIFQNYYLNRSLNFNDINCL